MEGRLLRLADTDLDVSSVLDALGVEVVSQRGDWADALCPLHSENDPSFSVNLTHGGWVCRPCCARGQLLDLVSRVREISRGDAIQWARGQGSRERSSAELINSLLPREAPVSVSLAWAERYDELSPTMMTEYWFERGFNESTMRQFDVRFDPDQETLIWPVRDESANTVSFIKRRLPGTRGAKYLYPSGFNRALFPQDHFDYGDRALLVEGPLDSMWLHQHGYPSALSTLGSDVTRRQVDWLRGKVGEVTLAFDNDAAGWRATELLVGQLSRHGFGVSVVRLPRNFKDVQELNEAELKEALAGARSALAVKFGV